ncbi:hypothetical protein CISIN_1g0211522mg, partial [Citrus sinensis]
SEGR